MAESYRFWLNENLDKISCLNCKTEFMPPKYELVDRFHCPKCGSVYINDKKALDELIDSLSRIYENEAIVYDENLENAIYFLTKYRHLVNKSTVLEECFEELASEILPEDYVIVDPVGGIQAIEIMKEDMLKILKSKKKGILSWLSIK